MTFAERSDAELLALAREGVAPAFAVLLHRHGPTVLTLAEPADPDPVGATVATFVRAMRGLADTPPGDVRRWLLELAAEEIEGELTVPPPGASGGDTDGGTETATITRTTARTDERLDEVWAELALRWPNGRVPRHVPSWAIWLLTTLLLMGAAVALPWLVLGASADDDLAIEELRASPVLEDLTFQEEVIEEQPEELPTFEFPEPPEEPPAPEPAPAPAPPPAPEPEEEPTEPDEPDDEVDEEAAEGDDGDGDTGEDGDASEDGDGDGNGDDGDEDSEVGDSEEEGDEEEPDQASDGDDEAGGEEPGGA